MNEDVWWGNGREGDLLRWLARMDDGEMWWDFGTVNYHLTFTRYYKSYLAGEGIKSLPPPQIETAFSPDLIPSPPPLSPTEPPTLPACRKTALKPRLIKPPSPTPSTFTVGDYDNNILFNLTIKMSTFEFHYFLSFTFCHKVPTFLLNEEINFYLKKISPFISETNKLLIDHITSK